MLNGNANSRWKKLFKQRDPVFREVANVHVHTRGLTPQGAAKKVIDMVSERAVHVTGAAIEPYDVVIGEGAMNHLVDAGTQTQNRAYPHSAGQRTPIAPAPCWCQAAMRFPTS